MAKQIARRRRFNMTIDLSFVVGAEEGSPATEWSTEFEADLLARTLATDLVREDQVLGSLRDLELTTEFDVNVSGTAEDLTEDEADEADEADGVGEDEIHKVTMYAPDATIDDYPRGSRVRVSYRAPAEQGEEEGTSLYGKTIDAVVVGVPTNGKQFLLVEAEIVPGVSMLQTVDPRYCLPLEA